MTFLGRPEERKYFASRILQERQIGFWILYLLIGVSALYLLQRYVSIPFAASSRFVLFILLTIYLIWRRHLLFSLPMLYVGLACAVVGAGVHTYFMHDWKLAVHASARFGNVMLIAPFVSLLFSTERDLVPVFRIFLAVFLGAFASLLFQYGGGAMEQLIQGYVAIRGNLYRYMTIVGEPNVGGMLAVIAFVIAISLPRRKAWGVFFSGLAFAFSVLSLSKGAIVGLVVVALLLFAITPKGQRHEVALRSALAVVFGISFLLIIGAQDYCLISAKSIWGSISGEPSVWDDFQSRQSGIGVDFEAVFSRSLLPFPLNIIFGASFGVVGSAAQEILGANGKIVLPHNSYIELFLAGGLVTLGMTLALMLRALRRLLPAWSRPNHVLDRCALVCLVILSCWMLVFPVIYEPVTGALFWTIIGYGNRVQHGDA